MKTFHQRAKAYFLHSLSVFSFLPLASLSPSRPFSKTTVAFILELILSRQFCKSNKIFSDIMHCRTCKLQQHLTIIKSPIHRIPFNYIIKQVEKFNNDFAIDRNSNSSRLFEFSQNICEFGVPITETMHKHLAKDNLHAPLISIPN